ncbi:MAG: multiprotein bridging factor aMBF1 [Candidatus Woesearchaeota archaeon]
MGTCELCGSEAPLLAAIIEGTQMTVCQGCAKFGKVIQKPVLHAKKSVPSIPEVAEVVVPDYAQKLRAAREKLGLTQKEFAMKLNEKESIIHKIENSQFVPPISMARKLEKLLRIKLVEVEQEEKAETVKKGTGSLTIGDIINLKK